MDFESTFPPDYRKIDIEAILRFITAGKFCQLISLPGGGKATLLKLLAFNERVKEFHLKDKKDQFIFIYLNLLELPSFEQITIDKFLLLSLKEATMQQFNNGIIPTDPLVLSQTLKDTVGLLVNKEQKTLVFLFDHFDEFQNQLPRSFFQTLRTLRNLAKYRFSVVFASRRDLTELVDAELLKEFYDFFVDNAIYMRPFDKGAATFIFFQVEKVLGRKLNDEEKNKLVELTGGHTKLLKVCTENVLLEKTPVDINSLLEKQIVKASLFELWLFLTPQEQQVLASKSHLPGVHPRFAKTSLGESATWKVTRQRPRLLPGETDFLGNIGLLSDKKFTIPLFEEFVKNQALTMKQLSNETIAYNPQTKEILKGSMVLSDLLSPLEFRLLRFLIENKERIIERDEIINSVWDTKSVEGVTDQAIDQLIFRLRQKIEDNPNTPKHLQTLKGRGIRFIP